MGWKKLSLCKCRKFKGLQKKESTSYIGLKWTEKDNGKLEERERLDIFNVALRRLATSEK